MQRLTGLFWPIVLSILVPLTAAWFAYPDHLPPGFGVFPPLFVEEAPGFKLIVFVALALVELGILAFLLYPRLFGFRIPVPPPRPTPARLPVWFWIGAAGTLFFWWLMWSRVTLFGDLVYYAFTPLWWSFILALDGLAYRRSGGYSLLATRPMTLLLSAIVSLVGWCYFEYLDYFSLGNWYYPNSNQIPELGHGTIVVLFLLAYTTVWPVIFEWYTLLNSFPTLATRYSEGPKLALPGNLLLWGGLFLIAAMVFFPYPLFWVTWIGPLALFSGQLIRKNIWTPFTALAQGNWGPMILMALAGLFNGFVWELWNWGSAHPALPITNPNYWMYDIPYVNVIHLFSEMPLLGYLGYMPFGILAWAIFIWLGELFGFDTALLQAPGKTAPAIDGGNTPIAAPGGLTSDGSA